MMQQMSSIITERINYSVCSTYVRTYVLFSHNAIDSYTSIIHCSLMTSSYWRPKGVQSAAVDAVRDHSGTSSSDLLPALTNRHKHLSVDQQRQLLPIFHCRRQILYALEKYTTVVLVGGSFISDQ